MRCLCETTCETEVPRSRSASRKTVVTAWGLAHAPVRVGLHKDRGHSERARRVEESAGQHPSLFLAQKCDVVPSTPFATRNSAQDDTEMALCEYLPLLAHAEGRRGGEARATDDDAPGGAVLLRNAVSFEPSTLPLTMTPAPLTMTPASTASVPQGSAATEPETAGRPTSEPHSERTKDRRLQAVLPSFSSKLRHGFGERARPGFEVRLFCGALTVWAFSSALFCEKRRAFPPRSAFIP